MKRARRKLEHGQMLVGYRFNWPMDEDIEPLRNGAGQTMVVDQIACAGPIVYIALKVGGVAQCRGCRKTSDVFMRADAIRRWAHLHRCEPGLRIDEMAHAVLDSGQQTMWGDR